MMTLVTSTPSSGTQPEQFDALASNGDAPTSGVGPIDVVLVHGIGTQREGTTVTSFSNHLARALRAEFGSDAVTQTNTYIRDASPARTTLTLTDTSDRAPWSVTIREAHWADVFHPPKTRAVLGWALLLAPLAVVVRSVHIVRNAVWRWWDHPLDWWRIVFASVIAVAAWPISVVLIASVLFSSVVRPLIPIRFLKEALARFEVVVSEVLGDAYLFIISEADRSAIQTVVGDQLERSDGRPVVLIAHSQGAQIAVDAIAERFAKVNELITVGAAIGQIEWFRRLYQEPFRKWLVVGAPGVFYGALGFVVWSMTQLGEDAHGTTWTVSGFQAFVAGVVYAGMALWIGHHVLPFYIFREEEKRRLSSVEHWTNIEATADPVSAGELVGLAYGGATERIITNRSNVLTDHTTYFENAEVMRVVKWRLHRALTGNEPDSQAQERDDRSRRVRYQSSRYLAVMRLLIATLVITTAMSLAPSWTVRANTLWEVVTPGQLAGFMNWFGALGSYGIQVREVFLGVCILAAACLIYLLVLGLIAAWRIEGFGPRGLRLFRVIAWILDAALVAFCVTVVNWHDQSLASLVDAIEVASTLTIAALLVVGLACIPGAVRRRLVRIAGAGAGWALAAPAMFAGTFTLTVLKPVDIDDFGYARWTNLMIWLGLGLLFIVLVRLTNYLNGLSTSEEKEWVGFSIADKPAPGIVGRWLGVVLVVTALTGYAWFELDQYAIRRLILIAGTFLAALVAFLEDYKLRARLSFGGALSLLFAIQLVDFTTRHD